MKQSKRTQKNFLELEEESLLVFERFMDEMPGGFFVYRADDAEEFLYINRAMLRIFGCDTEEEFRELTRNSFHHMVHPDDIREVQRSIAAQIADSTYDLDYVEYRIRKKDGTVRWVEDYGHFLHDKKYGDIFYVFIEDATERLKKRTEQLEEINRELRQLYIRESQYKKAILHDAFSFFEINLTSDEFVTNITQMVEGHTVDLFDFMGVQHFQKFSEYVSFWAEQMIPDELNKFKNFFHVERLIRCYEKGELEQAYNGWSVDAQGRRRLNRYVVLLGRNEYSGDIIALVIAKDITDQVEGQRLLQIALQQAQAANVAKNAFLANMSHDIRTPLNAIIGFTDLIDTHLSDRNKVKTYLEKIRDSSNQLLMSVNESLEITRMESGKAALAETECSIEELLDEVEEKARIAVRPKGHRLTVDCSGVRHHAVVLDIVRMREILDQLLDNAVKYTAPGGRISLQVRELEEAPKGYGKYQFIVSDNGIGISEDFLDKMFEPFERENNTTKSGVMGSGLGLALTKNLVDMMEGTIQVSSRVGEGSQFVVTLLFRLQADQSPHAVLPRTLNVEELKGKRVLLAEDNEINSEIAKELLTDQGFLVYTARDGQEVVDMIRESAPGDYDVVLMDIQMPVKDGYEAAREIRRLPNTDLAGIPIIAVSANAFAEDQEKSLEAGMNCHFPKPIDIEKLCETIGKVLCSADRDGTETGKKTKMESKALKTKR